MSFDRGDRVLVKDDDRPITVLGYQDDGRVICRRPGDGVVWLENYEPSVLILCPVSGAAADHAGRMAAIHADHLVRMAEANADHLVRMAAIRRQGYWTLLMFLTAPAVVAAIAIACRAVARL